MAKRVKLRGMDRLQLGVLQRAESDAAARQVARDLCSDGITQAERIALSEFLDQVARAIRWPRLPI